MRSRPTDHPRDEIMRTMGRIYRDRMTTTSGGNLSIRDSDGNIWISPARVDKGKLTRDDIVCVRPDGTTVGRHPASSEFPFHRALYKARPDIDAIVHAHPVSLVAFSICRDVPNTRLFPQAHAVCGKVGFAPYRCPGSEALGQSIAETFQKGCDSVILENHGVVVGGGSMPEAFQRFEAFEFAGKTLIKAGQIGPVQFLDDEQLSAADDRGAAWTGQITSGACSAEQEQRKQLCDFVRRGCRQRLLISTEGSFSARVSDDSFVITPTGVDRQFLQPDDLVLIRGDDCEVGKTPSRAARAHQAIYRRHPHAGAVVFAHPINVTAFSVTRTDLNVRTIPESYVFLRDVRRVPWGTHYGDAANIADYVSAANPAAILQNDGALVAGVDVFDTFDRLEVLEATAEAVIDAGSIGPVQVMSDEVIEELCTAFGLNGE